MARTAACSHNRTFGHVLRGRFKLGYHFRPDRLSVAAKTIENFVARAIRLYEQEPGEACASARLGLYVERWVRWMRAGLAETRDTACWSTETLGP